jgi:hypothetical protein
MPRQGLQQGDSLSPMLFLLIMEVLGALIHKADTWSLFQPFRTRLPHRACFYADDLVLFVSPNHRDLQTMHCILSVFEDSFGQGCNLARCQMAPIRCSEDQLQIAADTFPCQVMECPIRYLRIPLPPFSCSLIESRITYRSGKVDFFIGVVVVKSTLMAVPIYTSISIRLPPWFLRSCRRIMSAFLWTGTDTVQNGKTLVALSVMDLRLMGVTMRVRWLWLLKTDPARAWTSLPCTVDSLSTMLFDASVELQLGNGERFLFWTDAWFQGARLADLAPDLVVAVSTTAKKHRTVASAMMDNAWIRDITGALTVPVIMQFIEIRQQLQDTHINGEALDTYWWHWEASGAYSCRSAYSALFAGQTQILGAPQVWKTRAPSKCRFFMWTLLLGRSWMAECHHRHGLASSADCTLCSQALEFIDHMFICCVFSKEVWFKVLRRCGWDHLLPAAPGPLVEWWLASRKRVPKPRRRVFDSTVLAVTWSIWLVRNDRAFNRVSSDPNVMAAKAWDLLSLWAHARLVDWSRLLGE